MFRRPVALEYQVIDHTHKLRGAIDRIDLISNSEIDMAKDIELPIVTEEQWNDASDYISKSRCSTFFDNFYGCPMKYKKQYIDKILPRESNHVMSVGTRFHEFAELFMKVRDNYPVEQWESFIHPDFTEEEVDMLKWFIKFEMDRYLNNNDNFVNDTIEIIEYKTSRSINKQKLQFEFGFYNILVDCIDELKDFDKVFSVIYPRLQTAVSFNPSRYTTIMKKVNTINDAINNMAFDPRCNGVEYCNPFCDICTLEEIIEAREDYTRKTKKV